ncbi:aspartyl-tRNA(Asn)/glutamyl-tRNA(Gln) amidotransferase subunit A [Bradyrhizobium japonicum]
MHKKSVEEAVTSLHDLSAVDLIAGYRAKQFSPSEVLEDVLAHVAAWEPHLKALYAFDPDSAREAAKASTARWSGGEPSGALDGVPVTVKDNIATKGVPVPLGAASVKLVPAEKDAPPAARLREAGAIIFAKTTMPDYGMLSSGLSSFHALARNPWDLSKNPGGSSAGAGAAAAAGYGPLHLGTDIGGSVRLPAGWCGLVGLKPSFGRVPIDPTYVGRVAGPMTRTVDDCALMMSVIAKPDRRDGMSLPAEPLNWKGLEKSPRKLRIGLMLDAGVGLPAERPVRDVAVKAAKAFESAGSVVTEVDGILTREMLDGLDNFWRSRMWDDLAKLTPAEQAKVLPYIFKWGASGRKALGRRRDPRIQPDHGDPRGCVKAVLRARLRDLADRAERELPGGLGFTHQRSHEAVRTHLLYRAVEYVGKPRGFRQWRLRRQRLSHRRTDRRPPLRRYRRARHGQGFRGPARRAEALAEPAGDLSRCRHPGKRAL